MDSDPNILKKKGTNKPKDSNSDTDQTEEDKKIWYKEWFKKWKSMTFSNKFIVVFTAIIAISNVVYVIISRLQWDVTERQLKAMQLDQRPWLGVTEYQVTQFGKDVLFKFQATVINSGKTPANNVTYWAHFQTYAGELLRGLKPDWLENQVFKPMASFPPQGKHTLYGSSDRPVTSIDYNAVMQKSEIMYIFGDIKYSIGTERFGLTKFCFYIIDPATKEWMHCENHNDIY